jgi:hypothetical protein
MVGTLDDYPPLADLARIVLVCLVVAVVAPTAVWVSIAGLERSEGIGDRPANRQVGFALVAVGVAVLAGLIGAGLYALFTD